MRACPDLFELERIATLKAPDDPLAEHVSGCSSCRAILDHVRENNALLSEVRFAVAAEVPSPTPAVHAVAGYELLGEIGHGGQGRVFLAKQRGTHRRVALKFMLDFGKRDERRRARFEREIELAARLNHPGIVSVFEGGATAAGELFCAMQFVEGRPLSSQVLREAAKPGNPREFTSTIIQLLLNICDAVHYAHLRGVIHRDLKPGNILIDPDMRPHILDFGLARATDADSGNPAERFTRTGDFLGTLAYAAPEQVRGDATAVDVRSDVYALGLILYELLCERLPYAVDIGLARVIENISSTEPASMSAGRLSAMAHVDDELETITRKALAKEPDRRYQSAGDLAADLRRYLAGEPVEAKRESRGYVLRKFIGRHRLAVGTAGAFTLLLVGSTVVTTWLWWTATHAEARADSAEFTAARRAEFVKMETTRVEAITRFLSGLLETPDPGGKTADVSPRELLDRAAANVERELGDQPDLAAGMKDVIGATYHTLGDYETAERFLRDALAQHRRTAADRPDSLGVSLVNLASIIEDRGQHREAEALCREGLGVLETAFGKSDENYINSLNVLSHILESQQRIDEAEAVMREALELVRNVYGPTAAPLASRLNGLALMLDARGDKAGAEQVLREALEISTKGNGPRHPITATILNNLAGTLSDQGRWSDAEPLFRSAVELQESLTGREDPEFATCQHNLAVCLSRQGRNTEAEPLAREALRVRENGLGPRHEDVGRTRVCLAAILAAQGAIDDARLLALEAMDAFDALDPPNPELVLRARDLLDQLSESSTSRPTREIRD